MGVDKDYKNPKEAKYIFINGSNDVVFKHIWFGGGGNDMRTVTLPYYFFYAQEPHFFKQVSRGVSFELGLLKGLVFQD